MVKLYCRGRYFNGPRGLLFDKGIIAVLPEVAEYLLRDAPENFCIELPEAKALDEPVADKAVKSPSRKKQAARRRKARLSGKT